ncbi:MAG: thiol peroxidase [Deltaproteobacteria bacterium]
MVQKAHLGGRPFVLAGRRLEPGEHAPNFTVVSVDMAEVRLSELGTGVKVITFFPSLDTAVCSDQVKEFNHRAVKAGRDVRVIGISMDLPFAQKRFCEANGITTMSVYSDYRYASFGSTYGVLIEDVGLLGRGACVIDNGNVLRSFHLSKAMDEPVDFDSIMASLERVLASPKAEGPAFPWRCIPCEKGSESLRPGRLDELLATRDRHWRMEEPKTLVKDFSFRDFPAAMRFTGILAEISKEEGYAPSLAIDRNRLTVRLSTGGGLTENEIIMSRLIDDITF